MKLARRLSSATLALAMVAAAVGSANASVGEQQDATAAAALCPTGTTPYAIDCLSCGGHHIFCM